MSAPAAPEEDAQAYANDDLASRPDATGPGSLSPLAGTSEFVGVFYIDYEVDHLDNKEATFWVPEGVRALNVTAYLETKDSGPYVHKYYSGVCICWVANVIMAPPEEGEGSGDIVWDYAVPDQAGVAEREMQVIQGPYQAYIRDPEPGWWKFIVGGEGQNLRARWDLTFEYGEHDPGIIVGITQGVANSTFEVIGPLNVPWAPAIATADRLHQNFTVGPNASHVFVEMNVLVPREGPYFVSAKSEAERRLASVFIGQYHEETLHRIGPINPAAGNADAPFVHQGPFNFTIEGPAEDTWKIVTSGMGENIQLQAMVYVTYPVLNE